ncbi:MAG: hypothetical protein J6Q61_05885 [Bacteroidales bacterium]|nr:hypothetical protein [Bacteroidales bacterium]
MKIGNELSIFNKNISSEEATVPMQVGDEARSAESLQNKIAKKSKR